MIIGTISNVEKNNFLPVAGEGASLSIEPLLRTWSRYDLTFQNTEGHGIGLGNTHTFFAGLLLNRVGIEGPYGFATSVCPLLVEWTNMTPVDGGGIYTGITGTVTELWKSFGVEVARRLNVDPGCGVAGVATRKGPRYSLLLSGTEYRGYVNYNPSGGNTPLAIVAGPMGGVEFPIRLGCGASNALSFQVRDIMIGGDLGSKTIYANRDKQEDSQIVFTADSGTDVITSVAHNYVDGASLTVRNSGGGLPAGLVVATKYYVRDKTADTFKLAATSGGAAINITSNGTGTQYAMLTMHFRIYQKNNRPGAPDGIPVDIDA